MRRHILDAMPDVVINVLDASNLERNLFLTTQLIDMDLKVVIALNMYDELEKSGLKLDYRNLGRMIGIPIVPTVASRGEGIRELFKTVIDVFEDNEPIVRHIHINYGKDIEHSIRLLQDEIWKIPTWSPAIRRAIWRSNCFVTIKTDTKWSNRPPTSPR